MSMNEYNKHSILGPFAGRATTVAAIAGQEAYKRAHEQPVYVTGSGKKMTVRGALWTLAAFVAVSALGTAGAFLLPEKLASISGYIALLGIIGLTLIGIAVTIEAVKRSAAWVMSSAIEQGWWRIVAVTFAALVFASIYADAIAPVEGWMAALGALTLALAARLVPPLRSACAALGAGTVTYILAASYAFEGSTVMALIAGASIAAVVYGSGYALRNLRNRETAR